MAHTLSLPENWTESAWMKVVTVIDSYLEFKLCLFWSSNIDVLREIAEIVNVKIFNLIIWMTTCYSHYPSSQNIK